MTNGFEITSQPAQMRIIRANEGIGSAPNGISTGPFLVQTLLEGKAEEEMTAMQVFFEPGVIPHWHSHPMGQFLFVTEGIGQIQVENGEIITVYPGDSVWFAPNKPHWHGATPSSSFSYISIQQIKNGVSVNWLTPAQIQEKKL